MPTGKSKDYPHPKNDRPPQTDQFHLFSIYATAKNPQPSPMHRIARASCLLINFGVGVADTLVIFGLPVAPRTAESDAIGSMVAVGVRVGVGVGVFVGVGVRVGVGVGVGVHVG